MNPKGFITIVESIYHQLVQEQPTGESHNYKIPLQSNEQPFDRRLSLGDTPKTLKDIGCWIKEASLVVIINTGDIVVETMGCVVRPGVNCRFEPKNLDQLTLSGATTVRVIVYPR